MRSLVAALALLAGIAGAVQAPSDARAAPVALQVTATLVRSGMGVRRVETYNTNPAVNPLQTTENSWVYYDWRASWRFRSVRATGGSALSRPVPDFASAMGFANSGDVVSDNAGICPANSGTLGGGCIQCVQSLARPEPFAAWARLVVGGAHTFTVPPHRKVIVKLRDQWAIIMGLPGVGVSQRLSQTPCGAGSGGPEDGTLFFSGHHVDDADLGPAGLGAANHSLEFAFRSPTSTIRACERAYSAHAQPATLAARCTISTKVPPSMTKDVFQDQHTSGNGAVTATRGGSLGDVFVRLQFSAVSTAGGRVMASPPCVVPSLTGRTSQQLLPALLAAGCDLGKATTDETSTAASGTVLSQTPTPGKRLKAGATVDVVLSGTRPAIL